MKKIALKISVIVALILSATITTYANQEPKVIVGTCLSVQEGKVTIKGSDGNVYQLALDSIDSSIKVNDGSEQVNVSSMDGVSDIQVGSTVVVNIKGVVLVEVKETQK